MGFISIRKAKQELIENFKQKNKKHRQIKVNIGIFGRPATRGPSSLIQAIGEQFHPWIIFLYIFPCVLRGMLVSTKCYWGHFRKCLEFEDGPLVISQKCTIGFFNSFLVPNSWSFSSNQSLIYELLISFPHLGVSHLRKFSFPQNDLWFYSCLVAFW